MKFSTTEIKQFKVVQNDETRNAQDVIWDPPEFAKFLGPVKVSAEACLVDKDVLVKGEVSADLKFNCVRCLNDFEAPHKAQFQQIYSIDDEIIDISREVRESFLIDLPMHPICGPACKGVLAKQTNQDNPSVLYSDEIKSDPRWDELKKIKKNNGQTIN